MGKCFRVSQQGGLGRRGIKYCEEFKWNLFTLLRSIALISVFLCHISIFMLRLSVAPLDNMTAGHFHTFFDPWLLIFPALSGTCSLVKYLRYLLQCSSFCLGEEKVNREKKEG